MAIKPNDKVLRLVLASIINSDLSAFELRRMAEEVRDGSFVETLSRILSNISFELEHPSIEQVPKRLSSADAIMRVIKNRRISKSKLRARMLQIGPPSLVGRFSDDQTVKGMVDEFLRAAPNAGTTLMNALSDDNRDEFLTGILKGRGS